MPVGPRNCFQEERPFVDREEFIQTFKDSVANIGQKKYNVLVYYGVGGIGKTSLRKELPKLLEKHNESHKDLDVIWAGVDFSIESHRQADKFLVILKNEFQEKYGVKFHLFDIGQAIYWRKVNPQIPLQKERYSEESIVTDLVDIFGDLVSINYGRIKEVVERAPDRFKEWTLKREKDLANLENMEAADIEKNLPVFWAYDLADYLKNTSNSAVIFIDTYEALWENRRGQGNFNSKDVWIRDLVAELPGVLWVICGREAIRWEENDSDWKEYLEQHNIEKLPEKDTINLLNLCGVENENIQKVILDSSKGVPYYLDLAIYTHNQIKKDRQPVPDDFARTPSKVFERFIKYLDKQETETLKVLSAPRFWDYYLFEALVKNFNTGYPLTAFSDLGNFSFTSQNNDGKWYMHQLMKESLQEYQDPDLRQRVRRFIFEYYDEKLKDIDIKSITEEHKNALMEGFYHAKIVLETSELLKWLVTNSESFDDAALWSLIFPLYEEMLQIQETKLVTEHPDIATTLHKTALLYKKTGRYKEALPFYQRSLKIRENMMEPDNTDVANTLKDMAAIYRRMGMYEEAVPLCNRALEIHEKVLGPEHLYVAKTLNVMAILYKNMGEYKKALLFYQRALKIHEKESEDEHLYVAKILNNMAILYRRMGRYEDAVSLCQRALDIKEKALGSSNPSVATTLNNLADIFIYIKKYEDAVSLCQRALDIQEKALGSSNPSIAYTLNSLAEVYGCMGKYEQSLSIYQRTLNIREKMLGSEHPETATTLNGLAELYESMGESEKAQLLYQRALEIREKVPGPEHPDTAKTLSDLAGLYRSMGESEKALPLYHRALKIYGMTLDAGHPDILKISNSLAAIDKKIGKSEGDKFQENS